MSRQMRDTYSSTVTAAALAALEAGRDTVPAVVDDAHHGR